MPSLADLAAYNTPPQVQSSMPSSGGGGGGDKGFSLFGWHPSLPNLGGITAIKQLASGFIGLPEQAYHVGHDVFTGDFGDLNPINPDTTVGKFTFGLGHSIENAATTAASVAGVPFTRYNLGDELLAPALQHLNELGPQEHDKAGHELPSYRPTSWTQRPGGPIAGLVQDLSTAAIVAGPVAGALGKTAAAAGEAADAAEAAAAAGTGSEATAASARAYANSAKRQAAIAEAVHHPYKTAGSAVANVAHEAWNKLNPAISEIPAKAETPLEVVARRAEEQTGVHMDIHQVGQALRDLKNPVESAASNVARPGDRVTLYRGSDNPEASGQQGSWWRTDAPQGRSGYEHWQTTEVPKERLPALQQAAEGQRGEFAPRPGVDVYLDPNDPANQPAFDWAKPHEPERVPKEPKIGEPQPRITPEGEVAQPVNPKEIQGEQAQQVSEAVNAARETHGAQSAVADEMARRLALPAPAWAKRVVNFLPDSVNRVIASLSSPIDKLRLNAVKRDYERYVELSQQAARNDDMVKAAGAPAAKIIAQVAPELSRFEASQMVAEEMGAKIDGTSFADSYVKDMGAGADPEIVQALHNTARRGYQGITKSVLDRLTPEQHAEILQHIDNAVGEYGRVNAERMQTLLASNQGARGLESALLANDAPTMSPRQVRLYRTAIRDLRREAVLRVREQERLLRDGAKVERAYLLTPKAAEEATRLRDQAVGLDRAAENLHDSVPLAMRPENEPGAVLNIRQTVAAVGHAIYDVGRNIHALLPERGYYIPIAHQFDVPLEEWAANGDAILHEAMHHPVNPEGDLYGSGVWAGTDARLRVVQHVGEDGRQYVRGEIGMPTWGGRQTPLGLAVTLGEAHRMPSITDLATGADVMLSQQPDVQNLFAHYASAAIDSKSGYSRFARKLEEVDSKLPGMPAEATAETMRLYATWDYALSRSNPSEWDTGKYFDHIAVSYGKGVPTTAALMQSVLGITDADGVVRGLTTREGFNAAMKAFGGDQVAEYFRWYHDSHDYVEKTWRYNADGSVKMITLLDGTQRPAADVFYDLLAVTSVMANPKQNFGRALMAMSNLKDLYAEQGRSMAAAKSLMARLDKMQPAIVRVKNVGKENEEVVAKGGTVLSSKFFNTEELRRLTEGTSMTNEPKLNVIDILSGRLNLATATNEQIRTLPEWWKGYSKRAKGRGAGGVEEITAEQYRASRGEVPERAREVTPEQFHAEAQAGKKIIAAKMKKSTPNTLDADALAPDLYQRVQEEWGGATIDAHTGAHFEPGAENDYTVTAKARGQQSVSVPLNATQEEFTAALREALVRFKPQLDSEGAHLGVFQDPTVGTIDIDPVYNTTSLAESDAIGARTGALGGAYHHQSGNGYFAPYTDERAVMERSGSALLGKLRSYRDNLADPVNSMAVTLDSVMASHFGFVNTHWDKIGAMSEKGAEIRQLADELTQAYGRPVMPHEVQALLWVYTKMELGRQDWGRLLFHHDAAWHEIDAMEKQVRNGQVINPNAFDPLADYFEEEGGYNREAAAHRAIHGRSSFSSEKMRATEAMVARNRENLRELPEDTGAYNYETRYEIPSNDADATSGRVMKYLDVRDNIRTAIAHGAFDQAKELLTQYVQGQRRGIMGDAEGGSLAKVGPEALADETTSAAQAAENIGRGNRRVPAPNMSLDELHQQFMGHIRGAMLLQPDKTGRYMVRLFHDAALDTLAHEGAHVLRQILPGSHMGVVREAYPGIEGALGEARRVADEERFAGDLMHYIRTHAADETGAMAPVFRRIAATLEEQHAAMMDTISGRSMSPDISLFWDNLFHPGIVAPDKIVDPINLQRNTAMAGVETKQFPWESPAEFAQRARQYGEARANAVAMHYRANVAARAAAKADAAARRMAVALLETPSKIAREADRLGASAHAVLEKLGTELEDPNTLAVPREWQPMWESFNTLRDMAKESPVIGEYLDEVPATFSAMLAKAAELGIEPQYIPDVTWEQAQRYLFSHVQLGGRDIDKEIISGMRKENNQVLNKAGLNVRTLETLSAAGPMATHELYSNALVNFIQDSWARRFTPGAKIPQGWKAWDPAREFILTGTDKRGEFVGANANWIIPEHVDRALTSMSRRYDHWTFHTLSKVTKPWITYNLTMSPKWYLHVFVSNVVRTIGEGVSLKDWATVIKQWKTGTIPEEVYSHGISTLMQDGEHSLLGRTIAEAKQTEGMRSALHEVRGRVARIHDVTDRMSRAAIYEHTLRSTGSREAAITRMYEGAIDYGNLSPFERAAVRSLIPFYPFYKGMVKLLARFPADHPMATALLMMSGKMHQEYLQDQLGGKLPDAYLGVANIFGLHNFTILDPFINPTHLVDIHEVNSTFNPFVDIMLRDAYNAAEPGTGQPGFDATGHPVTEVNPAKALGSTFASTPFTRLLAQSVGGGDVYGKDPGVAGAVGQFVGVPTTPDLTKIQDTVGKQVASQTGVSNAPTDFATALKKALARPPSTQRIKMSPQQKLVQKQVRAAVRRIRGTKPRRSTHRSHFPHVRKIRAPRP